MFQRISVPVIPILVCAMLIAPSFSRAAVIDVPADQPTIQAGIDAAVNGDTVLAAPGVYYENINFREKGITVASRYLLNHDPAYVDSTVINGSAPANPDTASCVLIVSDSAYTTADTTASLIGFTITAGSGTKWTDEHGAGLYREGGGILVQYLSPVIMHNVIVDNNATNTSGVTSAGGGGIRVGDGNPRIYNNLIIADSGQYGGGIVLNYTGAILRNNVIAGNGARGAYGGGGGIWAYANGAYPKVLENNTIAYNAPGGSPAGGGLRVWSTTVDLRSSIVWGNVNRQIYGTASVSYSDIQDTIWPGIGNINSAPMFEAQDYYLYGSSPCVDAGDTAFAYRDPEDTLSAGHALWPAMGLLRNDMGAYGGPGSAVITAKPYAVEETEDRGDDAGLPPAVRVVIRPNPFQSWTEIQCRVDANGFETAAGLGRVSLKIYDRCGQVVKTFSPDPGSSVRWLGDDDAGRGLPDGVYFAVLSAGGYTAVSKMVMLR